jgi:hypothetical protein
MIDESTIKGMVDYALNAYVLVTALAGAGIYALDFGIKLIKKDKKNNLENKLI